VVLVFGFVESTATAVVIVTVIVIVNVVDVPVLVHASLLSFVYKPPASVSGRLEAKR
jgi:hypothetical protein